MTAMAASVAGAGAGAARRALDRAVAGVRAARRAASRFAPGASAFSAAADAEAAAVRAVRNLRTFAPHYAALQWALLLASLSAAGHRSCVLALMAASKGVLLLLGCLKFGPAQSFPGSALLRRRIMVILAVLVFAGLAAAGAVSSVMAALGVGVPLVVLHASFRVRDDLEAPSPEAEEEEEEAAVVGEKKEDGDVEAGPTRRSTAVMAPRSPK